MEKLIEQIKNKKTELIAYKERLALKKIQAVARVTEIDAEILQVDNLLEIANG